VRPSGLVGGDDGGDVEGDIGRLPWPAKLQSQAIALGDINYLTRGEGAKADAINFAVIDRVWNLWKLRVAPSQAK